LKFFQQTLIENFQARFDFENSNAIVIAIENVSRSDQGLIESTALDQSDTFTIHEIAIYSDG
jgi:hypothetical protein